MGTGTGLGFFAAGAILYWAFEGDLPYIEDNALGVILMVVGAIAVAAGVAMHAQQTQANIGTGLGLMAAGAILTWAVDIDLPYVLEDALGVILVIAGVVTVGATLAMDMQRSRTRHVTDRRSERTPFR